MKKILIVLTLLVVGVGAAATFGVIKNPLTLVGASCEAAFADLYSQNRANLNNCNLEIRGGSFAPSEPIAKENNVVLIFDASGSMAGSVDGERKIDAAKAAVAEFVDQLEATNANVSVVVYGHQGDNTEVNKALSCAGIEELYTLGAASGSKIETTLRSFEPTGWTPIDDSLQKAYDILAPYNTDQYNNSIVLISDGIETCGGDPASTVLDMKLEGTNVTANVIGFDVDAEAALQLRAVASNSGGEYFAASSRGDLRYALQKHQAYMERFDYRMRRVSESLDDINSATEQHFDCVQALEVERAQMMLDIYASQKVATSCAADVDELYTKQYESVRGALWQSFDEMVENFKVKSRQ